MKKHSQLSTVLYNIIGTQNKIMLGILHLHMHGNSVGEGTAVWEILCHHAVISKISQLFSLVSTEGSEEAAGPVHKCDPNGSNGHCNLVGESSKLQASVLPRYLL